MEPLPTPLASKLLRLARGAIRARLDGRTTNPEPIDEPQLCVHRGAFVSLHRAGELRGCIGWIHAHAPLHETVTRMAVKAATSDPRMQPVRRDELPQLAIEISVLTPLTPLEPSEVQVGRHGLYIRRGERAGLLLPQVATSRGLDSETFLAWTCRKAGLPEDAWRLPDTEVLGFEAQVFSDAG